MSPGQTAPIDSFLAAHLLSQHTRKQAGHLQIPAKQKLSAECLRHLSIPARLKDTFAPSTHKTPQSSTLGILLSKSKPSLPPTHMHTQTQTQQRAVPGVPSKTTALCNWPGQTLQQTHQQGTYASCQAPSRNPHKCGKVLGSLLLLPPTPSTFIYFFYMFPLVWSAGSSLLMLLVVFEHPCVSLRLGRAHAPCSMAGNSRAMPFLPFGVVTGHLVLQS